MIVVVVGCVVFDVVMFGVMNVVVGGMLCDGIECG